MAEVSVDLRTVIRGALVATIHAHGPITMEFVDSAAKRINGSVRVAQKQAADHQPVEETQPTKAEQP